jgi:hypothetical protein
VVDAEYVAALRRLESLSPWTMTTGRDSSGDFFVSCVIREFSERVALKSSSRPLLTWLILQLVKRWEETLSPPADLERSDSRGSGSDDWDYETTEYPD